MATQKGINISLKQDTSDFLVTIDTQKIEQVLNNLLSNAIKFSKPNTNVVLRISATNNFFKSEVIDQGQGISEEDLTGIFKPFQTTKVKPTAGEKSTGLGLAITKKIITEHGGEIHVKSKPGEGSNFYFTLPYK